MANGSSTKRAAVITGASRGIGRAIAIRLAQEGLGVELWGRDEAALDAVRGEIAEAGGNAATARVDVTDLAQIDAAVADIEQRRGRVDVLVNNAGISGVTPLADDAAAARFEAILSTNLLGPYHVTRRVLPLMPPGWRSRIINMSSVLGKFGVPGYAAYCTSKHGIIGFTRALALELAPREITVNALCPGWVDTDMATQGVDQSAKALGISAEAFKAQALQAVPVGRFLEPEEVADLVAWVVSEGSRGMTGQAINLSGGATTA